jgi:hypothetical protein
LLVGAVADCVGVILALLNPPHIYWSGTLVSIGSSIMAAAVVAYLSPVNEVAYQKFMSLGIEDVYPSRSDIENRQWVKWLQKARRECVLLGIAHGNWCRDGEFEGALVERLSNNVKVKIFFLAPNGHAADQRTREDTGRDTKQTIQTSIRILWKIRQDLRADLREHLQLYVYEATPSLGVTWIDDFMISTHYLAGSSNVTSPSLLMEPGRLSSGQQDLYGIYAKNVQSIEVHFSTLITDQNIGEYAPERQA